MMEQRSNAVVSLFLICGLAGGAGCEDALVEISRSPSCRQDEAEASGATVRIPGDAPMVQAWRRLSAALNSEQRLTRLDDAELALTIACDATHLQIWPSSAVYRDWIVEVLKITSRPGALAGETTMDEARILHRALLVVPAQDPGRLPVINPFTGEYFSGAALRRWVYEVVQRASQFKEGPVLLRFDPSSQWVDAFEVIAALRDDGVRYIYIVREHDQEAEDEAR